MASRILTDQTLHNARNITSKKPTGKNTNEKKTNLKENQKFHDIMMTHFKFPYPFFQGYEFTLIKRIRNKKKMGVKREIVGAEAGG